MFLLRVLSAFIAALVFGAALIFFIGLFAGLGFWASERIVVWFYIRYILHAQTQVDVAPIILPML